MSEALSDGKHTGGNNASLAISYFIHKRNTEEIKPDRVMIFSKHQRFVCEAVTHECFRRKDAPNDQLSSACPRTRPAGLRHGVTMATPPD